jgi:hypothetical protein
MASVTLCRSVDEYVKAVGPHHAHDTERADAPYDRMLGRRCKICQVEARISIADFRGTGDLPHYEKQMEAFGGAKKKKQ